MGYLPSGKRLHNELERSTIFNGKIHYFYGHFYVADCNSHKTRPGNHLPFVEWIRRVDPKGKNLVSLGFCVELLKPEVFLVCKSNTK